MGSVRQVALVVAIAAIAAAPSRAGSNEFSPWKESGFVGAEQRWLESSEVYPRGVPSLPHRMDATVMYARGTPWTQARAVRQIRRTAAIFQACGIQIGRVRLARLRLGAGRRRIDATEADPETGVPSSVAELSAMIPSSTPYPAGFLIAGVSGTDLLAISYRALEEAGPGAPYLNTAWIGYRAHWLRRRDDRYSALAHEFAHLLCRCGHTPGPTSHLLHSARNFLSSAVLPEHCESFVSSPLVSANR